MDERILPVIVTTDAAFNACMEQDISAIYLYREVFKGRTNKIYQTLEEHGYEIPGLPLQRGVLFVKGVDIEQCTFPIPNYL